MVLQRATLDDYASIIAFYDDVIERTPEIEKYARWQKGLKTHSSGQFWDKFIRKTPLRASQRGFEVTPTASHLANHCIRSI